jgi:hypothetical protein
MTVKIEGWRDSVKEKGKLPAVGIVIFSFKNNQ